MNSWFIIAITALFVVGVIGEYFFKRMLKKDQYHSEFEALKIEYTRSNNLAKNELFGNVIDRAEEWLINEQMDNIKNPNFKSDVKLAFAVAILNALESFAENKRGQERNDNEKNLVLELTLVGQDIANELYKSGYISLEMVGNIEKDITNAGMKALSGVTMEELFNREK